ncbi:MAG: fatty acid desaturase [Deltaproteobacteria bacterium]|nr:fatty acid desaturase [Deltaproteobacteria bacterium]MBW2362896.1 fatty acid desaturase [Deltaproteobacteria bacterium]
MSNTALAADDLFPFAEARRIAQDLMEPSPAIYWADYLASATLGWVALFLAVKLPLLSVWQIAAQIVAALALYRSVLFIHELVHRKQGTFKAFRAVWNLTCGFPLMVPSFVYTRVHRDHHAAKIYGTEGDGEYVPFGARPPLGIVLYVLQILILPALLPLRFVLVTPLSLLSPKLRRLAWERISSLTIDYDYRRPPPDARDGKVWPLEEACTCLFGITFATLLLTGVWSTRVLLTWYVAVLMVFLLNSLRTLAAHAYRNIGDRLMSLDEQFLDSVDVPGNPLWTPLWAPVGLRFHATHHLFPGMPYHALGEANRRLQSQLSDNSLYQSSSRSSLRDALRRLWADASASA